MARLLRSDDILPAAAWYCGVDPEAMKTPALKATDRVRRAQLHAMYALRFAAFTHAEIGHVFGRAGRSIITTMQRGDLEMDAVNAVLERARTIEMPENDRREANRRRADRLEEELRAC